LLEVCRLRGAQADFAAAIHIQQSISSLAAQNDSVWCEAVASLGYLLYLRFERYGSISDLHEAVSNVSAPIHLAKQTIQIGVILSLPLGSFFGPDLAGLETPQICIAPSKA
jgi:hypothetical protein